MPLEAENLALEIVDRANIAIGAHDIFARIVSVGAVLIEIADETEILHMRVLDGEAEGGKGERRDVELARGKRGDLRCAAAEAHGLDGIGFAVMPQDVLLGENDRGELGRDDGPADADIDRLRRPPAGPADHQEGQRQSHRPPRSFTHPPCSLPPSERFIG